MGIKVSGVDALIAQLSQIGKKAERGVVNEIRQGAEDIAELARMYAPIDEGNLEDAIKVEEDRTGINGRVQAYVYVDGGIPSSTGGRVADYAILMHEGIQDGVDYNLGPRSKDKAESTGKIIGRKYLERAVDELRPQIMRRVAQRLKRDIG